MVQALKPKVFLLMLVFFFPIRCFSISPQGEVVSFPSGELTLKGVVYRPEGQGPFPAVLYNHGSAPGMLPKDAFEALGPVFAKRGWVFFWPYRRGQGLSASAGPYIGDEITAAIKTGGITAGAASKWSLHFSYWLSRGGKPENARVDSSRVGMNDAERKQETERPRWKLEPLGA